MRVNKACWIVPALLLALTAQAQQPIRVMQESPWVLSSLSSPSLRPIQAYWDPQEETYFIDLVAVFTEARMAVDTSQAVVQARSSRTVYEVDFNRGTILRQLEDELHQVDTLTTGGYYYSGDRFLLTPPNLERVFPEGTFIYDRTRLSLRLSQELFADAFRPQPLSPTLTLGPMLYGRKRRFIGGTQFGYRVNRTQRSTLDTDYYGFLSVHSNALWGQIRANGTASYDGELNVRQFSYMLDFPRSAYLSQIRVGRASVNQWPARQDYEGIQMSNRPLSTRHQQREAQLVGIAEPNALVSALVAGVVADRVQADGQGRYQLSVPAYYGTSRAELEILPATGGPPTRETRFLLITEDLLPAGTMYWDIQAGRDQFDSTAYGRARVDIGLSRNLTMLGSYTRSDTLQTGTFGLASNIAGSAMFSAEVAYPLPAARATLEFFRNRFQFQAEAAIATEPGLTYYRQRIVGRAGWNVGRLSMFLNGTRFESFGGSTSMRLDGSGHLRLSRRISLASAAGYGITQLGPDAPSDTRIEWRGSLTHYIRPRGLRGRIGFQAQGGRYESVDFTGMTLQVSYRSFSIGARVGYDHPAQGMNASFSVRLNAPWTSFSSHTVLDAENPYNQQSLYGSMMLSRGLLFSRHSQFWSSALLRPFMDIDRDGQWDSGEPPVSGLDLNVIRAKTEPNASGMFRADFLAPSTQYQVVIDPRSIPGSGLELPTGTAFSFMSDPGETKYIDIPVHRNTIVEGSVEDLPLSSPTLAVVIFFQDDSEVLRAAVSQQGRFTALLSPGTYRVELMDLLGQEDLSDYTRILDVRSVQTQSFEIR
ncbi:MAG: hypothetical protein F4120_02415 [Rhodothermaceae bacterium]|nr:hypothetical protein [Rhodothermaceae bacterium]MYC03451.1 hypothetical protein [Rhodothermaceae bacterium]MYI16462.1 hypothetical protein [Rhodothermaceae bacterium]